MQTHSWCSCYILCMKLILSLMPLRNGLDAVINVTLCVPHYAHTCICTQRHEIEMQAVWYKRKINLWRNCFRKWTCFIPSHPSIGWLFLFSWAVQPLQGAHNHHLPLIKNEGGFFFQSKDKGEVGKEKNKRQRPNTKSLQVCVPYQMGPPHFIPLFCHGLVQVQHSQTCWQPVFFQEEPVLCCSLSSLGHQKDQNHTAKLTQGLVASQCEREEEFKLNPIDYSRACNPTN